MTAYLWPGLFALFVWWFSTGGIIYLDGLKPSTFKWSMLGATAITAAAFYGLHVSANNAGIDGAYLAFASALIAWGWLEISFYMGYVTGIRKERCAHGCSGWAHFGHALQASLWHELAIVGFFGIVVWLTWEAPNQVGLWTFLILWWMHESARLNVFLGVRNLNEHFLPEHLDFLKGFLKKAEMNLLFPFSVTISTVICAMLVMEAGTAAGDFEKAGFTFLATMMALAILEHWFLVLPLPAEALWSWSLASRDEKPAGKGWTRTKDQRHDHAGAHGEARPAWSNS